MEENGFRWSVKARISVVLESQLEGSYIRHNEIELVVDCKKSTSTSCLEKCNMLMRSAKLGVDLVSMSALLPRIFFWVMFGKSLRKLVIARQAKTTRQLDLSGLTGFETALHALMEDEEGL